MGGGFWGGRGEGGRGGVCGCKLKVFFGFYILLRRDVFHGMVTSVIVFTDILFNLFLFFQDPRSLPVEYLRGT